MIEYYEKKSGFQHYRETITYFILAYVLGFIHLYIPTWLEKIASFAAGREILFREDLPEPIADKRWTQWVKLNNREN